MAFTTKQLFSLLTCLTATVLLAKVSVIKTFSQTLKLCADIRAPQWQALKRKRLHHSQFILLELAFSSWQGTSRRRAVKSAELMWRVGLSSVTRFTDAFMRKQMTRQCNVRSVSSGYMRVFIEEIWHCDGNLLSPVLNRDVQWLLCSFQEFECQEENGFAVVFSF